jgi:hypothetical protein
MKGTKEDTQNGKISYDHRLEELASLTSPKHPK